MYEKHDDEVLTKASQKYNLTKAEINEVFQELSTIEAKVEKANMSPQEVENELKKILTDRFK